MAELSAWLAEVIGLFDKTIQALLGMPVFLYLLGILAFLMMSGLFGWFIYLGRKGKL